MMEKEQRCYKTINAILSKHGKPPYKKEEIKAAIISSIREYDYITAVIAYLWGAYNNFDANAKIAFREIFADDLKEHDQTAFYFFSFYYTHDFKRTGFDRRQYGDRRESYSLDHFSDIIKDLRRGTERRKRIEKRTNWTRVTEWASVPFKATHSGREEVGSDDHLIGGTERLDQLTDTEYRQAADIESLNTILSSLVRYYETHIRQGQTEWMGVIDEKNFHRAKDVMRTLLKANLKTG
jgi:hypothetical protein